MITRKHYKSESNRNILAHLDCLVHLSPSIMLARRSSITVKKHATKIKLKELILHPMA